MSNYENLSKEITERMERDIAEGKHPTVGFDERNALRRKDNPHDYANVWRGAFIRDVDKILHCPYYNRYSDKTQVFSLRKNDDITHRSLHVQLVSRIARTLGKALGLNLDLIEAIALGHDIGHTPFGHTGERFLDALYAEHTGRRFNHNIHSVRVLDKLFPLNITLQTLDGIASHNGELELDEYRPAPLDGFAEFDKRIEECYLDSGAIKRMLPSTLEGCVVRISDIIAYLGKDRHDAEKSRILTARSFEQGGIGTTNAEIINNLMVNIIENSYGKPYIKMDEAHFKAMQEAKKVNYQIIYGDERVKFADATIKEMTAVLYEKFLSDLKEGRKNSLVFTHHIDYLQKPYYKRETPYMETEYNDIVVDYIASMTDDYFMDLYKHLFPDGKHDISYVGYFD
jgi:dGTPase